MKIYFKKDNAYNNVIFTDGETAKVFNGTPDGMFEGVDLYGDNAAQDLRDLYQAAAQSGDLNDFDEITGGDEIGDMDLDDAELIYEDQL